MSSSLPALWKVVKLIEQARLYPAGALPRGTHQSYPVPVPGAKGLRVAFFYCTAMIIRPGEGLQLLTPSYVAFLDATTGEFELLKAVVPGEFGQKHKEDEILGKYLTLPERMAAEFLTRQVLLYQAYDALLPAFAVDQADVPPQAKKAAREAQDVQKAAVQFRSLFPAVTEGPLQGYYQALGKDFFAWLNRLAPEADAEA